MDLIQKISEVTGITVKQVMATVKLFDEENTVPFIARYRKEWTGGLDEVQIRDIERQLKYFRILQERKITILESIEKQGKLTDELKDRIGGCEKLQELEDLYLPYKPKKRTRATIAKEKGLEPLADKVMDEADPASYASEYVDEKKGVKNVQEALQGAMDIVAERVAEEADIRSFMRDALLSRGEFKVKEKNLKQNSEFEMYKDYKEPVAEIKPHRILAINRGEKVGELSVKIDFPDEFMLKNINHFFIIEENQFLLLAIEDSYKRLLKPSIEREVRSILSEKAEKGAIQVFSKNLGKLLMQPPLKGFIVMGIDPGIRTGSKFAIMNKNGEFAAHGLFYQDKVEPSAMVLKQFVEKYKVQIIAIGNGTGFRDVEKIVAATIKTYNLDTKYTVIPETGASVYSASEIAREEFPDLDLTVRGAISIGRRLQDPISELVKIDPKSIGVGQYQHDVDQTGLAEELDHVVEDCVNLIGVNLNRSSYSLLKYVSGITSRLARKIVTYRQMKGPFNSRKMLLDVPGVGPKVFEQAAGFMKLPDSEDPLDNTWVHPENYEVGRELLKYKNGKKIEADKNVMKEISEKFKIGKTTIKDIIEALEKPNLDPRDDIEKPTLRAEVLSIEDLKEGMVLPGTVRNVVDFGAFVDIGIKNDGMVHISEIADQFIEHPLDALQVGDKVEAMVIGIDRDRDRVALSIKQAKLQKTK